MRVYWDSSALILAIHDKNLLGRIGDRGDATRVHTLAEVFCTLTKGIVYRYTAEDAAGIISDLAAKLRFVELTPGDAIAALNSARRHGVRGARVHDLLHAAAATKYNADILLTLDTSGFCDLGVEVRIEHPIPGKVP